MRSREELIDEYMEKFCASSDVRDEAMSTVGDWLQSSEPSVEVKALFAAWNADQGSNYYAALGIAAANLLDKALVETAEWYAIDKADMERMFGPDE